MKAPLTVQNVHASDEEARMLQQRLEGEASREAINAATSSRAQSRPTMTTLEKTKAKLRQQLAAAGQDLAQARSCTECSDRALAAAEQSARSLAASRPQPRQ